MADLIYADDKTWTTDTYTITLGTFDVAPVGLHVDQLSYVDLKDWKEDWREGHVIPLTRKAEPVRPSQPLPRRAISLEDL